MKKQLILFICIIIPGNPFKIDKRMMVDEADIDIVGATSSATKGGLKRPLPASESGSPAALRPTPNKRKPGPIPREMTFKRPTSPASSTASSPASSPNPYIEEVKEPPSPVALLNSVASLLNSNVTSPPPSPLDKLVNGVAETLLEPAPSPSPSLPPPTPTPTPTPQPPPPVTNNLTNDVKVERTDECRKLNNDSADNQNCGVKVKEEPVANHVEEKRLDKDVKLINKKNAEEIRQYNVGLRNLVYKEVRRKGTSKYCVFFCVFFSFFYF